jgi:hypothetical protein
VVRAGPEVLPNHGEALPNGPSVRSRLSPPELRDVVRLMQLGHLMHHHVLGHRRRQQDVFR